ncbi:DUF2069 domain-containing protein [Pseudomonas neustonica]|uniref:DUF2069 domain-containing protein n=1 Tax=Pseudomonas neustonica TaxID=2487346 RepID=A0ABX9XEG9_9PSED|nr:MULTISPECIES: DUF2069 domain-containing protein [Pseudomonas]MAB22863.1 hypothetical protein [Pseudomonadales bacterium]MBA6421491.1 DUF2069 domain-containing protein [Pseudomonas sp. 5Ae-yellow]ROZ80789.1 DUF2069 domain-containing protein [Pseudomonas sp. SSM44]ROZ82045.1 DUF2069 domain-containing protein [Pseudomonas neustonica]
MSKKPKLLPSLSYLQPRIKISRWIALIGYLGLIVVMLGYNLLYADMHGANPVIIIAVQLLPLSIFLPGILIGHVRTHAWLCFAINMYFIQGVLICFQPGRLNYGLLMSGLSVLYFIAALYFVRWSFQAQRVIAGEQSS